MRHPLRLLTLITLLSCWFNFALAQTAKPDSADVMRQLLSMPAPTPRTALNLDDTPPPRAHSRKFYEKDNVPPDDAPIEDVLDYWGRWANRLDRPALSNAIKQRLLDACTDDRDRLPEYLPLFSSDEPTVKRIKELFDKAVSDGAVNGWWEEKVRQWLIFNSRFFLDELFALARKVKDNQYGSVQDAEALTALSHLDWQTAEPLINTLVNGNQVRSSALAVSLLYQQAITTKDLAGEEKYRHRLKTIASDRTLPAGARATAIEVLSTTDWSGRDDWYLSLLADDSLRDPTDIQNGFTPLREVFNRDPDKWIPVMIRLVESKDRAVQQAAASLLVMYGTDHPRRDVILPVIRWLSDPDWLDFNGTRRTWFMQRMSDVDIPESISGLIWIVENDEENRPWAAHTLAHYKDPRAVPVLRKALAQTDEDHRRLIFEVMIASGGLPDTEAVAALETYIARQETPEGRDEFNGYRPYDSPLPLPISIAKYLTTIPEVPGSLARAVLARAESLKTSNTAMAQSLLTIANKWRSRDIDLDIIHRIAAGSADANTIATALARSTSLRENLNAELQTMLEQTDEPLGIGAVLLNDSQLAQSILTSDNQPAQIALLAGARLTQTPLPVELVGKLLQSKNALLALAAERYLMAEDSLAARKLLWQHHPDQAFVTGWRDNVVVSGGLSPEVVAKAEEKLRAELFKTDGPLQIFALVTNGDRNNRVLRIYANKAIYAFYEDSARYRERVISDAELASFNDFVTTSGLEDQGPTFGPCHHDCMTSEFLMLKKDRPWRVLSHQGMLGWSELAATFDLLGQGEGVKIHYELEKHIKGLEVLFADKDLKVKNVWQRGDEIRVFVYREETEDEQKQRLSSIPDNDEEDEAARAERSEKERALEKARLSWRKFTDNKPGPITAEPEIFAGSDAKKSTPKYDDYLTSVVTPDGKWLVATKRNSDWSKPKYVVRRNLQTGQELRVKIDPADDVRPVVFVSLHNKVLVRRAKEDFRSASFSRGPDHPEYYLVDPATGLTQLVTGEFLPLYDQDSRALQPTGQPNEFWAAISDEEKDQTEVGRYNLKDFSFKAVLTIPQINFDSMSMWVDETHDKLYVVYKNQLIRLPLKPATDPPD